MRCLLLGNTYWYRNTKVLRCKQQLRCFRDTRHHCLVSRRSTLEVFFADGKYSFQGHVESSPSAQHRTHAVRRVGTAKMRVGVCGLCGSGRQKSLPSVRLEHAHRCRWVPITVIRMVETLEMTLRVQIGVWRYLMFNSRPFWGGG